MKNFIKKYIFPEWKLADEETLELKRELNKLKQKLEAIKKSDKYVVIQPTVEVKGLSRLKRPLYLDGDNMFITKNTISMKSNSRKDIAMLGIFGDHAIVQNSNFLGNSSTAIKLKSKKSIKK